jgi:hypothetical protein
MQRSAKLGELEQLLVGRIASKSVAPLDWRSNQLEIRNWGGLVEECVSSSADPFGMLAPPPRVADSVESDEADLRELCALLTRALGGKDNDEERAVASDKKRRKVRHERDTRVANDALPAPNETVADWVNRLPVLIDVNGTRSALFGALRSYSNRFGGTRFADLATGDRRVLAAFVSQIQEAAA